MIKEVDGKIEGNIESTIKKVSGNVRSKGASISGNVQPAGQRIVYDAYWGGITGEIENQEDLQVELRKRDTEAVPVSEVERILYFD